ncbi:hypothetical protein EDC04DRAFT_439608 [Pisolithus marmoratus]|nr:hypothetical protein EDC04DRAFT_439608 [Pisolithus marmoratus]
MSVIDNVKKHIENSEDWGKYKFQFSALSQEVTHFNFVAHENTSNTGDKVGGKELPPTNHWSLFLTINRGSSVRVEVAPNDPGKPGMVIIENKNYDASTKITKKVSIDVPKAPTVADIFNLIIQKKRDYYIFAPVGEGCRFWLYTLAGDFVGANLISKANAESVQSALKKYWPYPTGTPPVDRAMTEGQFPKSGH